MALRRILLTLFALSITPAAHAGLYFEPFAGYHQGATNYKVKDSVPLVGGYEDKGSVNGLIYGLGVGYVFSFGLILGADYHRADLTSKYDKEDESSKMAQTTTYFIAGYRPQKNAKVYVGAGTLTMETAKDPKTKMTGGALKAGASYEFAHNISLNVEYILYSVNESQTAGSDKFKIGDVYDKYNYSGYVLNLRFPFETGSRGK